MSDKHLATDTVSDRNPTARHPWTVTLCWTPDQNSGHVSIYPHRSPLFAIWGQMTDLRVDLPPEVIPAARRAVAARATDADDLRRLLWMLGLLTDPLAKRGRS